MGKFYLRDEDYIRKESNGNMRWEKKNKSFLPWACQKTGHMRERGKRS